MVSVSRAIGRKRALEMLFTGDKIDARTAAEWGLVNRVVPAGELVAATDALIRRATRGSAFSKGLGKQAYYAQIDLDQPKAYAYAVEVMASGAVSADGQESIQRLRRETPPPFYGLAASEARLPAYARLRLAARSACDSPLRRARFSGRRALRSGR